MESYRRKAELDNLQTNIVAASWGIQLMSRTIENQKWSSQFSEQVNYGTQPEERVEEFEDYDWDEDRMVKYRYNEDTGIHGI